MPGGGLTLVTLADSLKGSGAGTRVLREALYQPFRQLMLNAGLNAEALLAQVQSAKPGLGIDVNSPGKLVDLKATGVVDPVMVTKQAIQNAVSIAATAMTMGALVVNIPEKEAPTASAGMGGMGY